MRHSASLILRDLLVGDSDSLFTLPEDGGTWPVFIGSMPDESPTPSPTIQTCASIHDTAPVKKARYFTGVYDFQYGFQVMMRSVGYAVGWEKANEIVDVLQAVHRQTVVLDGVSYLIDSVVLTSGPLSLGQDDKRRSLFTVNGLLIL